jgi:transcription antitermination protein NusB
LFFFIKLALNFSGLFLNVIIYYIYTFFIKMIAQENADEFPLSKLKTINGSRRLAREKVLQVLMAHEISGTPWPALFSHIFFRKFNFGDLEEKYEKKILTEAEVMEIESDIPIAWDDEEIMFGRNLIKLTLENGEFVDKLIQNFAANWELERIAKIDKILMHIAITELMKFEEIPTKVSINEAIDIAKKYSTPKSGTFINGVLDSVQIQLKKEELIKKSGRGLIDK